MNVHDIIIDTIDVVTLLITVRTNKTFGFISTTIPIAY